MSLFKKFVDKFTNKSETAAPIQEIEIKELPKDDIWSKPITLEIKDSDWDELASDLIQSDLGRELTSELIEAGKRSKEKPLQAIKLKLEEALSKKSRETKAGVILVVGVNGTGKTTSVAKLAKQLPGKTVLAAADTFRAAAVEQLSTWGQRIGVEVISGAANSDPAAVAFDASKKFMDSGADNLIVDTAGRLHNKADLMAELGKVRRVIEKSAPVSEVLLVIDATTGQNSLFKLSIVTGKQIGRAHV